MDYLHALYHALISIQVPSEKARAVVDAMERDMGTTLATKQDLKLLEQQLVGMRTELGQETRSVRSDVAKDLQSLRSDLAKDLQILRGDIGKDIALLRKDMDAMRLSTLVWLGSGMVAAVGVILGVTLAAMRAWM